MNRKAQISLILALVGLVWGLFLPYGMVAGGILSIASIVLGVLARREKAGGVATAGIIIGVIAFLFVLMGWSIIL